MVGKKDIKRFVKKFSLLAVLFSFFITACGDSDGGANTSTNAGTAALDEVYASEDDLPGCTEKYDGAVAFVKEGSTAFKCEDGRWENKGEYYANNDAIKNCTAKREGEVAYIVDEDKSLVCEDGKWVRASAKVPEPAERTSSSSSVILNDSEESSSSNASTSSSWNEGSGFSSSNGEIASNSSSSRNDNKEEYSSSVASSSSENLSSSSVASSSSVNSSSSIASSSSAESSSSSVVSSSSAILSSSAVELDCSALLEGTNGWSWDVPKECRFNPAITYGTMTDKRDNKVYKTIKIGSQTWMAENLNYADSVKTPSLLNRSWCYNDVAANCAVAGRLYTWAAAIDSVKLYDGDNGVDCGYGKTCTLPKKVQGICPDGWHLPTYTEGQTLRTTVDEVTSGTVLKSQTGWYNNGNGGTDAYGFSALPAGRRNDDGNFENVGLNAYFWSADESNGPTAYYLGLYYGNISAWMTNWRKYNGHSVRCIKD